MKNIGYKKGIVFGIIILFIGVGIHPVLSQETINTAISEVEEDCGCNPIDEVDIDSLSNSVKVFTSFVSVISRGNPEIREKWCLL